MTKVVVAMSGGVDSSVAAALLKQQGFDVVGMMLRLWSEPGKVESNRCCTPDAMTLAKRVAAHLEIPFYAIDAKEIFRSVVVQDFLDGYGKGETPNPCLVCNKTIRWKFLLDHALAIGAEFMATGHYVRLRKKDKRNPKEPGDFDFEILRAMDRFKDQSYVLHILDQSQLRKAMFPIGGYSKTDVRKLAEGFGLPTASRADSQDLCFLAGEDYREFLIRNVPERIIPGDIVNEDGKLLGKHKGLSFYTIGQRKGLGLSHSEPFYVMRKDPATNTLLIGLENDLGQDELCTKDVNWIAGLPPENPFRAEVKVRYTGREAWAEVTPQIANGAHVKFEKPQRDITPGQYAVFYDGEIVLGGGKIC
jgi:tRNA-specific 2-thiouridylase